MFALVTLCPVSTIILYSTEVGKWHKEAFATERRIQALKEFIFCSYVNRHVFLI